MLTLGPAWCRDPRVGQGASLRVSLHPEGPQLDTIYPDFADALRTEPEARRFLVTNTAGSEQSAPKSADDQRHTTAGGADDSLVELASTMARA